MSNNEVMKLEEDKDLKGEFKELCTPGSVSGILMCRHSSRLVWTRYTSRIC